MEDFHAIQPKTWEELFAIGASLKNTKVVFHRFPHENSFYREEYMKFTPKELVIAERNKKMDRGYYITPNNFPYNRLLVHLPYVKHFLLWSANKPSSEEIESKLQRFFGNYKYFWYENLPKQKSIPEIFHIQIFVNLENSENMLRFLDSIE